MPRRLGRDRKSSNRRSTAVNPSAYRKGVGLVLVNADGKVFVGRRIDRTAESWQMPQGGIDADETPVEAAMRELHEEVGTNDARVMAESRRWLRYDLPRALRTKVWEGRYRGQMQKWFLLRFEGDDRDIRIDAHRHPEFSAWRWVPAGQMLDLIVPFKRRLYRMVLREFAASLAAMQPRHAHAKEKRAKVSPAKGKTAKKKPRTEETPPTQAARARRAPRLRKKP